MMVKRRAFASKHYQRRIRPQQGCAVALLVAAAVVAIGRHYAVMTVDRWETLMTEAGR